MGKEVIILVVSITKTSENQQVLDSLSEIESILYYRKDGSDPTQGVSMECIEETHALVKKALETWHKGTGLTIRG